MVGDILQPTHLLFILIVALLVLGPKRLPEMAKTLGSGLRDFKAAINGERDELRDSTGASELLDFKQTITGQADQRDTSAQPDTESAGSGVADGGMQAATGSDVSSPEPSQAETSPAGAGLFPEPEPTVAQPAPTAPQEPEPTVAQPAPAAPQEPEPTVAQPDAALPQAPELSPQPHATSSQNVEPAAEPDPAPSPDPVTSLQHSD